MSRNRTYCTGSTLRVVLFAILFLFSSVFSVAPVVWAETDEPQLQAVPTDAAQIRSAPDSQGTARPVDLLPSYNGHPLITGYCDYLAADSPGDSRERFFYSDGYFEDLKSVV